MKVEVDYLDPELKIQFDRVEIHKIGEPPPLQANEKPALRPEEKFEFTEQDEQAVEAAIDDDIAAHKEEYFRKKAEVGSEIKVKYEYTDEHGTHTEEGSFVPLAMSDADRKGYEKSKGDLYKMGLFAVKQRSERNRRLDDCYGIMGMLAKDLLGRQDPSTPSGRLRTKLALAGKFIADFVNLGDWSSEDIQVKAFGIVANEIRNQKQKGTEESLRKAEELRQANLDFRFALDDVRRSRMQLVQPLAEKLLELRGALSDGGNVSDNRLQELRDAISKLVGTLMNPTAKEKDSFKCAFAAEKFCKGAFNKLDGLLDKGLTKEGVGIGYETGKSGFVENGPGKGDDNARILADFCLKLSEIKMMTHSDLDTEASLRNSMEINGFELTDDGIVNSKGPADFRTEIARLDIVRETASQIERDEITDEFEVLKDLPLSQYDSLRRRAQENVNPNPRTVDGRLTMVADATTKALLNFVEDGWKPSLDRIDAEIAKLEEELGTLNDDGENHEKIVRMSARRERLIDCRARMRKAADEIIRSRMVMLDPVVRALAESDIRYDQMVDGSKAIAQIQANLARLKTAIGAFRLDFDNKAGVGRGKWESFKRWLGSAFSARHGKVLNKVANVFSTTERIGFRQAAFDDARAKVVDFNRLVRDLGYETPEVKGALTPIDERGGVLSGGDSSRTFSDTLHEINNSIRNTPEDLWLGHDFYVRMARKRLENLVPNGGSREFSFFVKGGAGFSLSETAKAEVLAKGGATYKIRCEGDGTVVVRVEGKAGIEGMFKASFGDNAKLKAGAALEAGGGVEFRYGDMESAAQAIGDSFMGKVGLSRTLDTAYRFAKTVFYPIIAPATWLWGKIVGNERYSDAEFVESMKRRGVLDEMAKESFGGKNILITGYRKFAAIDFGGNVDAAFKLGGENLSAGDKTTKRVIAGLSAGAGFKLGGDIASQAEYRPYLTYLLNDVAGSAGTSFDRSIRRGGTCLLSDPAAAALMEGLQGEALPSAGKFARLFDNLARSYVETARFEAGVLKELDRNAAAKRDQLRQLADRIRTTTEGVVALYEKWKASAACRDAEPTAREEVERNFASLRELLVKPPIDFGDDFRRELMVEHSFKDNTFRANFSAYFNSDVLTGLTNKMMVETSWLDDIKDIDAKKFFRRGAMGGVVGLVSNTPLNFKFGFDAEIVKPTSEHLEPWRNVSQTKLNLRMTAAHWETFALLSIVGTAIARQTGQPPPKTPSDLKAVLKSAGIFGAGLSMLMRMGNDLYNRIGKPLLGGQAVSGNQAILEGAKNFTKDSPVDFDKDSSANIQIVMVDNRVQTISFGTQDGVSLGVTFGEGVRFGVEYKDRNIVNLSTAYLDAPLTTLLDRCDRMTGGAQTSLWQEFSVRNRHVFGKLYDAIKEGLAGRLTNESDPSKVKDYNFLADEIGKIRNGYETLREDVSVPLDVRKSLMDNARRLEEALRAIRDGIQEEVQGEAELSTKTEAVRTLLECVVGHYHILDVAQKRVTGSQAEEASRYRVGDMRNADEALAELDKIRGEVEKFSSDDSVVRLEYTEPTEGRSREIESIREDTTDSVKGFLSTLKFNFGRDRALKFKNNCDRNAIRTLVFRACGVARYIDLPQNVKDVFKIDDFNADGRPLTKRRLLAIVDAVNRAKEDGTILKTRKPLEKGVVVQTPGSNCCFANAIVNGLKATEKGRQQLGSIVGEEGCTFFNEKGQKANYRWPKDIAWDDDGTVSPFETLMMEHMQTIDGIYKEEMMRSVTNGTSRPFGHAGKAAVMFGLESNEFLTSQIDHQLLAPELDDKALGENLALALKHGEVVVCNRTGGHFETIAEYDSKTGLCKLVSDVPDVHGGCVRWRKLRAVAQEMKGVGTSFQVFRMKQGEEERNATLTRLEPEFARLRKRFARDKSDEAIIDRFVQFLRSDAGRSSLQSIAYNDERFTLETAYGEWLLELQSEQARSWLRQVNA